MSELFDALRYWLNWNYVFLSQHIALVITTGVLLFVFADLLYSRGVAAGKKSSSSSADLVDSTSRIEQQRLI